VNFDFDAVAFEPKPVTAGGPPLHIGGDGAAALRRAATVGAGWIPMNHTLEQIPAARARLDALAQQHGRLQPIEITLGGTIESEADVDRYSEAGVDRVLVRPWTRQRDAIGAMDEFAARFITPPQGG
jgi:alkanesulfonate monooxygenase SsuD/methylene tetrahydromethanopterin reductase-like flavin-dependent oxidoreductase (luciferase family)